MIVVKDVQKKNGEPAILVQTDFSDRWNKVAGQMGGQYSRAYEGRIFDADLRPQIIAALNDVFLHDGSDGPAVTLSVALGKLSIDDDSLLIGPIQALKKWDRDRTPNLGKGVAVIQGALKPTGGSARYPRITFTDDCVIRIKDFPASAAAILIEREPEAYAIIDSDSDMEFSADEKALIDALREIEPARRQHLYNAV